MKLLKNLLINLLLPHIAVIIFIVPVAAIMLVYAFVRPDSHPLLIYSSYFLSAYALTILCAKLPEAFEKIKSLKEKNKYLRHYFTNPHLRVNISLLGSVTINSAYAVMQLVTGFFLHSIWFYALAVYYGLLALMRISLLRYTRSETPVQNRKNELYKYRTCGILLLVMNLSLAIIVFYIVYQNRGFSYHYIQTISLAAYSFTTITVAIVNVFRYRKYESPVLSAAKSISLAAACVSMLSLETAMLSAFGSNEFPVFRQAITAITGTVILVFVLCMAIYMILHANKEIKAIERKQYYEK